MQPTYSAEASSYREKVQAFLAEKLPTNWRGMGQLEGDELHQFVTEWRATLHDCGYLAPGWPKEFGGGGLSPLEQVLIGEEFAKAGADNITLHAEATPHVHYAISAIKEAGCTAGVALCPATPVRALAEIAADLDLALCMTINPGWGGQAFIPASPGKIERLRALIGAAPALEVDGGIDTGTAGTCAQSGATVFVAGTAVFGAADPGAAYRDIAAAAGV